MLKQGLSCADVNGDVLMCGRMAALMLMCRMMAALMMKCELTAAQVFKCDLMGVVRGVGRPSTCKHWPGTNSMEPMLSHASYDPLALARDGPYH